MKTNYLSILLLACTLIPWQAGATPSDVQKTTAVGKNYRTIKTVEPINVTTPVGTTPRLPYQVWVTYSDGTAEYRQVRWTNASPTRERHQSNATETPAGTTYQVLGYIIGDNTTPKGYR